MQKIKIAILGMGGVGGYYGGKLAYTFGVDNDDVKIYFIARGEHLKAIVYFRKALKLDRTCLAAWTLMGH